MLGVCYHFSLALAPALYSSTTTHHEIDHCNSFVNHAHSRRNKRGELGLDDMDNRGDSLDEMGDALPFVSLGTGQTASRMTMGVFHTCALLQTGGVKCWGCVLSLPSLSFLHRYTHANSLEDRPRFQIQLQRPAGTWRRQDPRHCC